MVDGTLPIQPKLRSLFLDLNSYFASVEQQEHPELRGKPVAVVPVMADTSFVIAASYEAKRVGVKTLTQIGEAKRLCPELILVKGGHVVYMEYHRRCLAAVEGVLPVEEVCSIDEMRFRLLGEEREAEAARTLALRLKAALREQVGECLTCSIGIAPNPFLAKLGTELQKPDGLVILEAKDLPEKLHALKLTEFTGINRRMEIRLNAAGIFTAEQLCAASREHLRRAFGGVIGERWWFLLRGADLGPQKTNRRSLGHSHVLPPDLRTDQGCREVLLRLLQKASARLRADSLATTSMSVQVTGFERSWAVTLPLPPTQDTVKMNEELLKAWGQRDFRRPRSVAVTFHGLQPAATVTGSLFEQGQDRSQLSHAVDRLNQRYGKNTVFLAGMERAKETAQERIAFQKTWLFSEGLGDNLWVPAEDAVESSSRT